MSLLSTTAWDALEYIMYADPCDINSQIPTSSSSAMKTMDSSEPNQRLKAAQTNQQNAKHSVSLSWLVLMMRTCSNTQPPTDKERTHVQCPVSTRNDPKLTSAPAFQDFRSNVPLGSLVIISSSTQTIRKAITQHPYHHHPEERASVLKIKQTCIYFSVPHNALNLY